MNKLMVAAAGGLAGVVFIAVIARVPAVRKIVGF